jgi:hypothetical protein
MTTFSTLGFARVFLRFAVAAKENLAAPPNLQSESHIADI